MNQTNKTVLFTALATAAVIGVLISILAVSGLLTFKLSTDSGEDIVELEDIIVEEAQDELETSSNLLNQLTEYPSENGDVLRFITPEPNAVIECPGVALGFIPLNWAFEGQFPVHILNNEFEEVEYTNASITGGFIVSDHVLFSALIACEDGACSTGSNIGGSACKNEECNYYLKLSKDNPSDLEVNDDSVTIPVSLGKSCFEVR